MKNFLIKISTIKAFFYGAILGLAIALVFGFITYPWADPTFEGSGGYHKLAMFFLTPLLCLGGGVLIVALKMIFFRTNKPDNSKDT